MTATETCTLSARKDGLSHVLTATITSDDEVQTVAVRVKAADVPKLLQGVALQTEITFHVEAR